MESVGWGRVWWGVVGCGGVGSVGWGGVGRPVTAGFLAFLGQPGWAFLFLTEDLP